MAGFNTILVTTSYRLMRLWFARDIWRYRNVFWLIDWLIVAYFFGPPCREVVLQADDWNGEGSLGKFGAVLGMEKKIWVLLVEERRQ